MKIFLIQTVGVLSSTSSRKSLICHCAMHVMCIPEDEIMRFWQTHVCIGSAKDSFPFLRLSYAHTFRSKSLISSSVTHNERTTVTMVHVGKKNFSSSLFF